MYKLFALMCVGFVVSLVIVMGPFPTTYKIGAAKYIVSFVMLCLLGSIYVMLSDKEPRQPNKAEERLRAKRLAEKGEDHG